MLKDLGMEVDLAHDGVKAQESVQRKHRETGGGYKLILMDFNMPECNGPSAAKAILEYLSENAPDLARPYICCLSAIDT